MFIQAAGVLKAYLEQRRLAGTTHVPLRQGMLERLRAAREKTARRAREVRRLVEEQPAFEKARPAPMPEPPLPPAAAAAPSGGPALIEVPGVTKAEKLAALAALAENAPGARALGTLRETMVFATGSADAEIMFVGEAPGAEEERLREPFVGPAGQKLTGILRAMGLERGQVYISNICKFRPSLPNQGSSNRAPTPEEMRACLPFILTEIGIVRPKVIVALGATAMQGLGLQGAVSSMRGRFHEVRGIPLMVTYHPSYILREETNSGGQAFAAKRQVWEDMLKVMEKCGMAVSARQRGYFQNKG